MVFTMPRIFSRKTKVKVTAPEELGLGVGLPAIVAVVPWVPQDAREQLSAIIFTALERLQQSQKIKE